MSTTDMEASTKMSDAREYTAAEIQRALESIGAAYMAGTVIPELEYLRTRTVEAEAAKKAEFDRMAEDLLTMMGDALDRQIGNCEYLEARGQFLTADALPLLRRAREIRDGGE